MGFRLVVLLGKCWQCMSPASFGPIPPSPTPPAPCATPTSVPTSSANQTANNRSSLAPNTSPTTTNVTAHTMEEERAETDLSSDRLLADVRHCRRHREPHDVNLVIPYCQYPLGCPRKANHGNLLVQSRAADNRDTTAFAAFNCSDSMACKVQPTVCLKHSSMGHAVVKGSEFCEFRGCTTLASFGLVGRWV